jgi:hypothetical protein
VVIVMRKPKANKVLTLEWRIDAKGDFVADAPFGLYRITYENADGYRVRFAGYPIALAQTSQGAKDYALIHLNR